MAESEILKSDSMVFLSGCMSQARFYMGARSSFGNCESLDFFLVFSSQCNPNNLIVVGYDSCSYFTYSGYYKGELFFRLFFPLLISTGV